jgi:hypothetical protein
MKRGSRQMYMIRTGKNILNLIFTVTLIQAYIFEAQDLLMLN